VSDKAIITFLIGLAILGYAVLIFNRQTKIEILREGARIEQEKQQTLEKKANEQERKLVICKNRAAEEHQGIYNQECRRLGRQDYCALPLWAVEHYDKKLQNDIGNCVKLYGN